MKRLLVLLAFALAAGYLMAQQITAPPKKKSAAPKPKSVSSIAITPEMILVKGGLFQMGSNNGRESEKPIHSVRVSDFFIGMYEVTQKQWIDVMGKNPSRFQGCDNCPVENVSWNDIQEFLRKLNQNSSRKYRLPTEAEWEYASRGGNQSRGYAYSGSNSIDEVAWYDKNSGSNTHTVGQKKPNEIGIYDMSGNVWEWCSDLYDEKYYTSSPSDNPKGALSGSYRVFRGGSWFGRSNENRSAVRGGNIPNLRGNSIGFRVARTN